MHVNPNVLPSNRRLRKEGVNEGISECVATISSIEYSWRRRPDSWGWTDPPGTPHMEKRYESMYQG
jgi:hypothetical protein